MIPPHYLDQLALIRNQAYFDAKRGHVELGYLELRRGWERACLLTEPWSEALSQRWEQTIAEFLDSNPDFTPARHHPASA